MQCKYVRPSRRYASVQQLAGRSVVVCALKKRDGLIIRYYRYVWCVCVCANRRINGWPVKSTKEESWTRRFLAKQESLMLRVDIIAGMPYCISKPTKESVEAALNHSIDRSWNGPIHLSIHSFMHCLLLQHQQQ